MLMHTLTCVIATLRHFSTLIILHVLNLRLGSMQGVLKCLPKVTLYIHSTGFQKYRLSWQFISVLDELYNYFELTIIDKNASGIITENRKCMLLENTFVLRYLGQFCLCFVSRQTCN